MNVTKIWVGGGGKLYSVSVLGGVKCISSGGGGSK